MTTYRDLDRNAERPARRTRASVRGALLFMNTVANHMRWPRTPLVVAAVLFLVPLVSSALPADPLINAFGYQGSTIVASICTSAILVIPPGVMVYLAWRERRWAAGRPFDLVGYRELLEAPFG